MTAFIVYSFGAAALIGLGLHGALSQRHLLRQIISLNIIGGGVFLFLIAVAHRNAPAGPDPIPQALVLTGIVVSISVTGLGIAIARTIHARSGRTTLRDEDLE